MNKTSTVARKVVNSILTNGRMNGRYVTIVTRNIQNAKILSGARRLREFRETYQSETGWPRESAYTYNDGTYTMSSKFVRWLGARA